MMSLGYYVVSKRSMDANRTMRILMQELASAIGHHIPQVACDDLPLARLPKEHKPSQTAIKGLLYVCIRVNMYIWREIYQYHILFCFVVIGWGYDTPI